MNLDLIFLTFLILMFGSIWIQSHMQATSQQSEILHYLIFTSIDALCLKSENYICSLAITRNTHISQALLKL